MSLYSNETLATNMVQSVHQKVFVDAVIETGSAFGITQEGEQVFINQRIVSALNVQPGETYEAWVVPNYEDKRDVTQWRAVRIKRLGAGIPAMRPRLSIATAPAPEPEVQPEVQPEPRSEEQVSLIDRIVKLLEDEEYLTVGEIADSLEVSSVTVQKELEKYSGVVSSVPAYFLA